MLRVCLSIQPAAVAIITVSVLAFADYLATYIPPFLCTMDLSAASSPKPKAAAEEVLAAVEELLQKN